MGAPGPVSSAGGAVDLALWQRVVTADRPRRLELLRLRPTWPVRRVVVQVHRNQPFEHVSQTWDPFLAYAGLEAEVVLGAYDDSLSLQDVDGGADLHLVSLDHDRLGTHLGAEDLAGWVASRVTALRAVSTAPVLVTDWAADDDRALRFNALLRTHLAGATDVHVAPVSTTRAQLGADFDDDRAAGVTASRWSDRAVLALAQELGLRWLPALLTPPVRGVVVDLDETLYRGVLAEDGVEGVQITPAHADLQAELRRLSGAGVFVAVSSRNDPDDVERLLAQREDLVLRRADLAVVAAGWEGKDAHVTAIAGALNIAPDALVLLDDNPGELAAVSAHHPGLRTLHAPDPQSALRALHRCPGLFRFRTSAEDGLRVRDRVAGIEREAGSRTAADPRGYLASLGVVLTVRRDDPRDVERIAELSSKTNQFATALRRTRPAELRDRLERGEVCTAAVSLRDRLSDSGTVAGVVARPEGATLVVEEVVISCRALGRGIEDALLARVLLDLASDTADSLELQWVTGPRNGPALEWLRRTTGGSLPSGPLPLDRPGLQELLDGSPLTFQSAGAPHD